MNWDDVKVFLALMRDGNVRAAAKSLGVSHSTVARRIEALEQKFSAQLFERLPIGYALTPAGEEMLKVAEVVEDQMTTLERRIEGHDNKLSGRLRVTMVDALATGLLMPDFKDFTQKYPQIDLEVPVTYESVDLDKREADIALRFTRHPPEHLVGRSLLICSTAAYACHDYAETHHLNDADSACWIGFGPHNPYPAWVKKSPYPNIPVRGRFVSLMVQLAACKSGMGMAMLPCFLGDAEPALKRMSEPRPDPNFELWILMHRDVRTNARIRIFSEFMSATILKYRPILDGSHMKA